MAGEPDQKGKLAPTNFPEKVFFWWPPWHRVRSEGHLPQAILFSLEVPFGCACAHVFITTLAYRLVGGLWLQFPFSSHSRR